MIINKIDNIEDDIKFLKNEINSILKNDNILEDESTIDTFMDLVKDNKEMMKLLKFIILMNSKNETKIKDLKLKLHSILNKIIVCKKESLEIIKVQQELIDELKNLIQEHKNSYNSKFLAFFEIIKSSKLLAIPFGFLVITTVIVLLDLISPEIFKDVIEFFKHIRIF